MPHDKQICDIDMLAKLWQKKRQQKLMLSKKNL